MQHRIPDTSVITAKQGEPLSCYRDWRSTLASDDDGLLLVDFQLEQYWLLDADPVPLVAIYCVTAGHLRVAVSDQCLVADNSPPAVQFDRWVAQYQLVSAATGAPLELLPESIPKPWGQEIWYTGVEERGVCHFGSCRRPAAEGSPPGSWPPDRRTPIPWLQAVLPEADAGQAGHPLVLLKVLDPAPQASTGDLYFELHEQKREVYVVTHIDESAWPDGTGYIRFGFSQERLARSDSAQDFRASYLSAVEAYEDVRRTIDTLPDGVDATPAQKARERRLRDDMHDFTHMRPLRVGDVVVVPPRLPHSLQHGVRTVEFQTPVYERKILSFTQKVLTQEGWDTRSALDQMLLDSPPDSPFSCLLQQDGVRVERIVDFPDFEVRRIRLEADRNLVLSLMQDYGLLMVVEGELVLAGCRYGAGQAILLPRGWQDTLSPTEPAQWLVLLLALPRS